MTKNIRAIILASGNSNRFGIENKLLAKLNGITLFENVLNLVTSVNCFSEIVVVTKYQEIIDICNKKNIEVIINNNSYIGISESISLGIIKDNKNIDGFMFFQADQPFISVDTVKKLIAQFEHNKIIVPIYNDTYGSPNIFAKKFYYDLLSLQGDNGGREIIATNKDVLITVHIENKFENIDIDKKEELNAYNKKFN